MEKSRWSETSEFQSVEHKPQYSMRRLLAYALAISIGSFQYGYSLGLYSPLSLVFMQLFHISGFSWCPASREPWNTLVSTLPQVGSCLGAFTAHLFVARSRVTGIMVFNLLTLIGTILIQFITMPLLLLGRFISGYGAGAFSFLIPLMLNEISPPRVRGGVSMLVQFQITFGVLMPAILGLGLPSFTTEVTTKQVLWRFIAAIPALTALIQIFLFRSVYRDDTPPSRLSHTDSAGALKALSLIYIDSKARLNQLEEEIALTQRASTQQGLAQNSFKALFVCLMLQVFKQLSGISAIYSYSSQLFASSQDPSNISQGNFAAMLIAAVNCLTAMASIPFVERLGRKRMLIIGFVFMGLSDILVGVFQQTGSQVPAQAMILLFITAYEFSAGPVLWVYMPEVLNSAGQTLAVAASWITIIFISVVTPYLQMAVGPWLFHIFGIFNILGCCFIASQVVESKGRSKLEIQLIYRGQKSLAAQDYGKNEALLKMSSD